MELAEPASRLDVVFAAGAAVSRELAPQAVAKGAVVIDNSSAFRMIPTFWWCRRSTLTPGRAWDNRQSQLSTIIALMEAPIHRRR